MSFRARLALTMSALILIIAAAIWIYVPRALEREAMVLMTHKAETLAQLTAFTIHPAVYFNDRAALEEALSGARQDKDVAYIIVTDPAGAQLAAFHPERAGHAGLHVVTLPIRDRGNDIARLQVGMSLERMHREIVRMRITIGILSAIILGGGLLTIFLISNFMTRPFVEERDAALRHLSRRLLSVQEEERTRIAREVHDELGQALTAMKIDLRHKPPQEVARRIDEIVDLVRRIASDLRPSIVDDLGMTAALEQQLRRLRESTAIETTLVVEDEPPLDMLSTVTLYRIAQEALANVVRHAGASAVEVALSIRDGSVILGISDNGRGVTAEQIASPGSLGLIGMRERAELLGGSVKIEGRMGEGTVVTVSLPLAKEEPNRASPVR